MCGMEEYQENKDVQQVLLKKIAKDSGLDNKKMKVLIWMR